MPEGYRTAAAVPRCARCEQPFAASDLILTDAGAWNCQPCIAVGKAKAASRLATDRWVSGGTPPTCAVVGCVFIGVFIGLFLGIALFARTCVSAY